MNTLVVQIPALVLLLVIILFFRRTETTSEYYQYYNYSGGVSGRLQLNDTIQLDGRTFNTSILLARDTRMKNASINLWNNLRFSGNLPASGPIFKNISTVDTCSSGTRDWSRVTPQGFTYDLSNHLFYVNTDSIQMQPYNRKCCGDCGQNRKTLRTIGCPSDGHMGAPAFKTETFYELDSRRRRYSTTYNRILVPLEKCGDKSIAIFRNTDLSYMGRVYFPEASYRHLAFIAVEPVSNLILTSPQQELNYLDVWNLNLFTARAIGNRYRLTKIGVVYLVNERREELTLGRVQSIAVRNNTLYVLSDYNSGEFLEGDNSRDGVYIFVMERIAGTNNKRAVLRQHIGVVKNESIFQELEGIYAFPDRIEVVMQEDDPGWNDSYFKTISVTPI